jgi:hypothetical protein
MSNDPNKPCFAFQLALHPAAAPYYELKPRKKANFNPNAPRNNDQRQQQCGVNSRPG